MVQIPGLQARRHGSVGRRPSLGACALGAAALALVLGLVVAPQAAIQGQPQRLMYLHVPSAWTAFLCFGCVALCSLAQLLRRPGPWSAIAQAAAEVGVVTTALTLLEGSLWGHSAWGVWWAWDPRLVSTALLFVSYLAYLSLRALPGGRVQRVAAWVGLASAFEIVVVHFSVIWWRTLHQPPTLIQPTLTPPPIAGLMLLALLAALVASTLGAAWYVRARVDQLLPRPLLRVPEQVGEPAPARMPERLS
jgi:heme exporter protein C